MQITDSDCEQFQKLSHELDGIEISGAEARDALTRVLHLFDLFSEWKGEGTPLKVEGDATPDV
jgi:hypothetical protein